MTTRRIPKIKTRVATEPDDDLGYLGCVFVDGETAYACGGTHGQTTILRSIDGGKTFVRRDAPPTSGLRWIGTHAGVLYVAGEYGTLAASVDGGLTWTAIPVDTQSCLFRLHREPAGMWWVIGDDGVVFTSRDGLTYTRVATDWDTRLLDITSIGGTVHILGYDGTIRRWTGSSLVPLSLDTGRALTQLIATTRRTWLVVGDHGTVFRSTDAGATWARVRVPTHADLEAIIETPRGIIVVGDDATILYSDDDGASFVRVPNDLDGHLWSLADRGDALLVGGDDGAIWTLAISDKDTMTVEIEPPAVDEDDEDEDDDEEDEEPAAPSVTFASVDEASARWIREGQVFSKGLNDYVRRVYAVGPNKAGHEPSETRGDMADYVREQLIQLNATGQYRRARELFPPAYEPFDYDSLGQAIAQVARLADGRLLARVGADVYFLGTTHIEPVPDLVFFAQSHDRRFVAKGFVDHVDIHDGWDGPCIATLPHTLDDPKSAALAPGGDALLVATDTGIYWVTANAKRRLLPEDPDDDCGSYPHAALSPNGRFVAMGTQDTSHIVVDRQTGRRYAFDPVSSYPHFAAFHGDRPEVVLSSCHALYGSGTLAVALDDLVADKPKASRILDRRAWVYAVGSAPSGYLLADRSGYIWALDWSGEQQWYAFVGSTLTALDISPDGKRLVVGSYAGYVIELELGGATDPLLLTNGPVLETARWVFWRGTPPLVW